MINRDGPPFNNPKLLRAAALSVDRKGFIDTLTEGKGNICGAMLPPPEGVWGMPAEMLKTLPGYDPDVPKNRAEARKIMEKLGYGPDKRLAVTVSTRNIPPYRDLAVILIDQLKEVYIDGQLEPIDTVQWLPRVMRKDYTVALNLTGNGLDDPDQTLYENFTCGPREIMTVTAIRNWTKWLIGNRWNSTRRSARRWCGRSNENWPKTRPGRSSITAVPGPAGSPL